MPALRRISNDERRTRLGRRHHLATDALAATAAEVAEDLVALHSTDAASVYLSVLARTRDCDIEAIGRALYDDRQLIRMLGMRRTVFVVPVALAPVVQAACTQTIAARLRRQYSQQLGDAGIAKDPGKWLAEVEESTMRALIARGEATAAQLSDDEPRLRERILVGEGKKYEAYQYVNTRVLTLLAADGRIMRGRPRGSWRSSQYSWLPAQSWLPGGMGDLDTEPAQVELAGRWLAAFGPGTVEDLKWWTGWTMGEAKRAVAGLDTVEVELDGGAGLVLADDQELTSPLGRWAALLPALDPTPMGWRRREWYLGDHAPSLFDRSGNIGPSIWLDGRIVGGWAHRKDGEIAFRLLEEVGTEALALVEAAAAELDRRLGKTTMTPRFGTPLARELSS